MSRRQPRRRRMFHNVSLKRYRQLMRELRLRALSCGAEIRLMRVSIRTPSTYRRLGETRAYTRVDGGRPIIRVCLYGKVGRGRVLWAVARELRQAMNRAEGRYSAHYDVVDYYDAQYNSMTMRLIEQLCFIPPSVAMPDIRATRLAEQDCSRFADRWCTARGLVRPNARRAAYDEYSNPLHDYLFYMWCHDSTGKRDMLGFSPFGSLWPRSSIRMYRPVKSRSELA